MVEDLDDASSSSSDGSGEGVTAAARARPRVAHAAILATVVAGCVVVVASSRRPAASTRMTALTDWSSIVSELDSASGGVYVDTEFAQCYTGFCTKNGDGLTASCGCLSVRPGNDGKLDFGWASAVLADSAVFRRALRKYEAGHEAKAKTLVEAAIDDGTLFDGYGFVPTRVSLYSEGNEYFDTSVTHCHKVSAAQCMGAPCFDREYDGVWNVTCICPYHSTSYTGAAGTRRKICSAADRTGDCALIGFGEGTTSYTAKGLRRMIDAVKDADVTIDRKQCAASEDADDDD